MRLKGKVAVVSGGTDGIGAAVARRFAAEGAMVAVSYAHNTERAEAILAELRSTGVRAEAFRGDWSRIDQIESAIEQISQRFGAVDILVNNAGSFRTVSIEDTTEAIWDEQLDLNLKGLFFAIRAVVPQMKQRGSGKIINMCSIAGIGAFPNCPAYCASKGGVLNLTRAAACELSPFGINVNGIAPGNVETAINAHVRADPGYVKSMARMTPSGIAFLQPDDIAGTAVYLASEDAALVHGATVVVDAGWTAW